MLYFLYRKDGSTFIWIIRMTFYQVMAQDIVMPFRVIVYVTQVLDFIWGIVDVALKLFPKVLNL